MFRRAFGDRLAQFGRAGLASASREHLHGRFRLGRARTHRLRTAVFERRRAARFVRAHETAVLLVVGQL